MSKEEKAGGRDRVIKNLVEVYTDRDPDVVEVELLQWWKIGDRVLSEFNEETGEYSIYVDYETVAIEVEYREVLEGSEYDTVDEYIRGTFPLPVRCGWFS